MKPKAPGYRVLIKPDSLAEFDKVYAAAEAIGLELAPTEERKEQSLIDTGIVVQLGAVAFIDRGGPEAWCKVGDRVAYTRHGGKVLKDPTNPNNKYLVINDEDVLLVWENENE